MTGRRSTMDSIGSTYEDCARYLLGQISSVIPVERHKDYGVDSYLQPRISAGPNTDTVGELGSIQVKGGSQTLRYGGSDSRGRWREYQLAWLRSLATPIYLARVDKGLTKVELFSLVGLWCIFWRQAAFPYEVSFTIEQATDLPYSWREPESSLHSKAAGKGDGNKWTVHLGPPFLQLSQAKLADTDFKRRAAEILRVWITSDRETLVRYLQFFPVMRLMTKWCTNPGPVIGSDIYFGDSRPGVNISRLCQTTAPLITDLGLHLKSPNDRSAYQLISTLQLLNENGSLGNVGLGLLGDLERNQSRGLGPAEPGG